MAYKTKPLEAFALSKELRNRHYENVMSAREQGKPLVMGGSNTPWELIEGFAPIEALEGEAYAATVASYPELVHAANEATDGWGYGRDVCAYVRSFWGSAFLNRSPWGEFPRPDFAFNLYFSFCGAQEKWYRVMAERFGVPYFVIDYPKAKGHTGMVPQEKHERFTKYLMEQYEAFVQWGEKVTGRRYDDEKLVQAVKHKRECQYYWGLVCDLNRNIPAPLTLRQMFNLIVPRVLWGARPEGSGFYRALYDEVKERAALGIAGQAEEKVRLLHDFVPPYIALDILRYLEDYGAALVVSQYAFAFGGGLTEEGVWGVVEPFPELGHPPRNRKEAFFDIANWDLKRDLYLNMYNSPSRVRWMQDFVERWHCNGAVFHLNRGEKGGLMGILDARLALKKMGIPVLLYEGSATDKRDVDIVKVKDAIDAFAESLGLKKVAAKSA